MVPWGELIAHLVTQKVPQARRCGQMLKKMHNLILEIKGIPLKHQ